jgi:hypothetical protein
MSAPDAAPEVEIPEELLCPITFSIMKDPVTLSDGHTFDRESIEAWFARGRHTNPLTNEGVDPADVKPNFALRSAIERYLADHPDAEAVPAPRTAAVPDMTFTVRSAGQAVTVEAVGKKTMPACVIAVIDKSGSMNCPSSRDGGGAIEEGAKFSRLDLVKHSLKAVKAMLGTGDAPSHFGIVRWVTGLVTGVEWSGPYCTTVNCCRVCVELQSMCFSRSQFAASRSLSSVPP